MCSMTVKLWNRILSKRNLCVGVYVKADWRVLFLADVSISESGDSFCQERCFMLLISIRAESVTFIGVT
jgi:hypothetical protein